MSFDVEVLGEEYDDECCECGQTRKRNRVLYEGNYTYNLSPLFFLLLGDKGLRGLNGMSGVEALSCIGAGIGKFRQLQGAGHDFTPYEPENGWGSVEGALAFLRRIENACTEPGAKVRVT